MNKVLEQIEKVGIIPIIKIDNVDSAVPLAKSLISGGIPCAEVTFRTAHAEDAIRYIAAEVPDILLGAGTVLTTEQVDKAVAAGAKFIVSPGFNPKVVAYCSEKGVPVTPGCSNPSDIEKAIELGLEVVKFFPAEQSGGLDYIKAVSAPYSSMKFIPTGGINKENIVKYLAFDKIIACGGSWMVNSDLVDAGKFDEITKLCREAVQSVMGFQLAHIGINGENADEAVKAAKMFETMFGFDFKEGNSSVFAGKYVEVMKSPYLGKHGHIAIAANSVPRARAVLERKGFVFNIESEKTNAEGKPVTIYLKDEILGFAVHLIQK